jgi:hypothetical protein
MFSDRTEAADDDSIPDKNLVLRMSEMLTREREVQFQRRVIRAF